MISNLTIKSKATPLKLLIITQAVDRDDPVLGFFHRWVEELAKHCESIHVICLKEGKHNLPANVQVHSLGKDNQKLEALPAGRQGRSSKLVPRLRYIWRFYKYVWELRGKYNSVFVHMNQEYVLFGGILWKMLRKRVFLWRNHYSGSFLTDMAALFCAKVFCTSKFSYTAKYKKTILMPIGIDTGTFKPVNGVGRKQSILSIGRIAPSKRLETLIDAVDILKRKGISMEANIYGDALPADAEYRESLIRKVLEKKLGDAIHFHAGISNAETPSLYSAHELFVNCSESGMYDKTIFEAAACGALTVASSRDYAEIADPRLVFDGTPENLANRIESLRALSPQEKDSMSRKARAIAEKNSLSKLAQSLASQLAFRG